MASILIIDDEAAIRTVVRMIFEATGHQVIEAENGRDGVRQFREHRPDLVITDIIMEVQDGLETIRQLRAEFPGVKIVAISGGSRKTGLTLQTALELGARVALPKPFTVENLRRTAERLLAEGPA